MSTKNKFINNPQKHGYMADESINTRSIRNDKSIKYVIKTGFTDLDQMIYGFHPGELILIGGRSSMGKTSLMRDMISHICVREQRSVLLFSLEDTKAQFVNLFLLSEMYESSPEYVLGYLASEEQDAPMSINSTN